MHTIWIVTGLVILLALCAWASFRTSVGSKCRVRLYPMFGKVGPWWWYKDSDYLHIAMVLEKLLSLRSGAVVLDARGCACVLKHLADLRPDVICLTGTPPDDASVDAILCTEGINDLSESEMKSLLGNSLNILKPGGFMWIAGVLDSTTYVPYFKDWTVNRVSKLAIADVAPHQIFKTVIIPQESLFGDRNYPAGSKSYFIHKKAPVTGMTVPA